MRFAFRLLSCLAVSAMVVIGGCSPKRIPGTDIDDSADTRAVVATVDAYRKAAENRDAPAVLALVSTKYLDDSGTSDPGDDVDYETLRKHISDDYARLTVIRLEIAIKRIEVEGDHASVYVFYDARYRIRTNAGEVPKQSSDVHRMQLVREQAAWHFVSGL